MNLGNASTAEEGPFLIYSKIIEKKPKTKQKQNIGKASKLCKCSLPSLKYLRSTYDLLYIHILYIYTHRWLVNKMKH